MKRSLQFASLVGALALATSTASAQVNFQGFTNGCFYLASGSACTPETNNVSRTDEIGSGPFRYTNTTGFNVTSAAGSATLTNLGTFDLVNSGNFNYGLYDFILRISFTVPSSVNPTSQLFTADITGQITQGQNGTVGVDFQNGAQSFTFDGGEFFVSVNDVAPMNIAAAPVNLTGTITVREFATVPEPSTYVLLASGLAGLGFVARRRRAA